MALDPTAQFILTALGKQGVKSFEQIGVENARAVIDTFPTLQNPPQDVKNVENRDLNGVPMRIYTPANANGSAILYVHGGGWIGGHLGVCDEPARAMANETGAVVVATSYNLAPESRFPRQVNDVFAAFQWLHANARRLGIDTNRVAVVGDSAGGNLAAITALRARDANLPLAAQVLIYPVIDRRSNGESKTKYAEGYLVTRPAVDWFWDQYLSRPEDIESPLASPLNDPKKLQGLAPALIVTVEFDASRDEGEAYGDALKKAGNDATVVRLKGLIHGVFWTSGAIPRSCEVMGALSDFLAPRLVSKEKAKAKPKG